MPPGVYCPHRADEHSAGLFSMSGLAAASINKLALPFPICCSHTILFLHADPMLPTGLVPASIPLGSLIRHYRSRCTGLPLDTQGSTSYCLTLDLYNAFETHENGCLTVPELLVSTSILNFTVGSLPKNQHGKCQTGRRLTMQQR